MQCDSKDNIIASGEYILGLSEIGLSIEKSLENIERDIVSWRNFLSYYNMVKNKRSFTMVQVDQKIFVAFPDIIKSNIERIMPLETYIGLENVINPTILQEILRYLNGVFDCEGQQYVCTEDKSS